MGIRSPLASTTARERRCARCGRRVLIALDEGLLARVDAAPANELESLARGLRTYDHTVTGQLIERTPERLSGAPRGVIHAEHRCGGSHA